MDPRIDVIRIRKWLIAAVLCTFALARVAFAAQACDFGASACPHAESGATRGDVRPHDDGCASAPTSSQKRCAEAAPLKAPGTGAAAIPARFEVAALQPAPRSSRLESERVPSSLLLTTGRLRL